MTSETTLDDRTESREISRQLARRLERRLDLPRRPLQRLASGTTLLASGSAVTRLAFIDAGRIDSVLHLTSGEGGRVLPVSWAAGEVVLLSHLFANRSSTVDLVAGTDVTLRWATVAELESALLADKDLLVLLVRFLAGRLREVQARERGWVERGVHERVCATLSRLAHQSPRDDKGHPLIAATHEELAERSGVSRPKLSQALKRLEQAGQLRLERGAIRVLDLNGLPGPPV